ncbi:MAG: hypothetical protein K2W95_14875 [Candidatus Obscuribacterales bacterium]|nr:hypothetical protein [Candidatus Obscuribacterales bacterium]
MTMWTGQTNPANATFVPQTSSLALPPNLALSHTDWQAICEPLAAFPSFDNHNVAVSRKSLLQAIFQRTRDVPAELITEMLLNFERRCASRLHSVQPTEIVSSYSLIAQLINDEPLTTSLSWKLRWLAALHFLSHLANPATITTGARIAATATCVVHRAVALHPARLANILHTIAMTGSVVLPGRHVSPDANSLNPGKEELLYRPGSQLRSYATKLLHLAIINGCLPESLTYCESNGRPGKHYKGQRITDIFGNDVSLAPELPLTALSKFNALNFGDAGTVLAHADTVSSSSDSKELVVFDTYNSFSDALEECAKRRSLPVTIAVDERRLMADSYRDGINHCINIVQFADFSTPHIFNPRLLHGMQRSTRLPLQKLYNATFAAKE